MSTITEATERLIHEAATAGKTYLDGAWVPGGGGKRHPRRRTP